MNPIWHYNKHCEVLVGCSKFGLLGDYIGLLTALSSCTELSYQDSRPAKIFSYVFYGSCFHLSRSVLWHMWRVTESVTCHVIVSMLEIVSTGPIITGQLNDLWPLLYFLICVANDRDLNTCSTCQQKCATAVLFNVLNATNNEIHSNQLSSNWDWNDS